jgi:hypothetical protein
MKNVFIAFTLLGIIVCSEISFGQKLALSIGGEIAFAGSSEGFGMNAGTGFGGSLRGESSLSKHISGIATVGYLAFSKKHPFSNTPATTTGVKATIVQAGIKYFPKEKNETANGPFISGELGFMSTNTHFDYAANPDYNFKESGLSFAPGIGYQLGNAELSFRLQYNLTASGFNIYYYNFRLAYSFLKIKDNK